jgi:peptidoglycan-associated lipoprotein
MSSLKPFPLLLVSVLVLSACGTTTKLDNNAAANAQPTAHTAADTQPVANASANVDPLNDPNSPLAKRSVFFNFDNYNVSDTYKPLISAHAGYLEQHANRKIDIQGNTDERGSSEYNLALGQRRAESVRKALAALGVPAAQMEAISFGKEKPKATGHDEAAWEQNRRADIVYSAK